ncbi:uncharacterized protein LOC125073729 [Vanessa atalanta]|uniref:uncharacterized protein LOC125073729 n=1 Tax=Vanessa atalanta TaxID=42275 RepID=UPI001FCD99E4|nr:uncharacterized protein LOC125073729 [Vanessa atalanta]
MLKIRQSLLPVVLLTTITFSSSNVLPILSINKLDTDSLLEDQDNDNTLNNNRHTNNPNVFYKVFIGTSKDNLPKKSQMTRLKYLDNDNNQERKIFNGLMDNDNNYDDEGFRKEQWHNYPRQLDRLNKNLLLDKQLQKVLNNDDMEKLKRTDDSQNLHHYISDDIYGNFDTDVIAGPLLILKIKLAYLTNNIKNTDSNTDFYADLLPLESTTDNDNDKIKDDDALFENNEKSVVKVKRKGKLHREDLSFLENSSNENKSVKKRIFSLWSRLQSLSHRGHELHHRRHLYAFYGLPEDGGGGALTAETRATLMRPPGSPLRWG